MRTWNSDKSWTAARYAPTRQLWAMVAIQGQLVVYLADDYAKIGGAAARSNWVRDKVVQLALGV